MPREIINPPELFKHSHYSRVLIVGQTVTVYLHRRNDARR